MIKKITNLSGCPDNVHCTDIPFRRVLIGAGIMTCLSMGLGCATQTQPASGHPVMNADHARELAFRYRGEALALSKLADGLELEAINASAQSQHSESNTATETRIQDLRRQAEVAFEQARQYRDQVPHNQVY